MKKNKTTLILIGILLILTLLYFFAPSSKTSLNTSETAFKIKDTASVVNITITQTLDSKPIDTLVLSKKSGEWFVNGSYPALQPAINYLLTVLERIQVREPIHQNAQQNARNYLADNNLHIEIQQVIEGETETKAYFIGTATPDKQGTIALLQGASNPFIVEIPGQHGQIAPIFSTEPNVWRENVLVNIHPDNIEFVSVQQQKDDSNFMLQRLAPNQPLLLQNQSNTDTNKTQHYLKTFTKLYAQAFINDLMPNGLDSLKKLRKPDIIFTIKPFHNSPQILNLYYRPETPNNYLGFLSNSKELLIVQQPIINPYFLPRKYFVK